MWSQGNKRKLRILTYLCPEMPLALHATYQRYLESALDCKSYLMVEANRHEPPTAGLDPFTLDEVDIAFTRARSYKRLRAESTDVELLPAAPVHVHTKAHLEPVYFSDVIVHHANTAKYKELVDLKGHIWGYNDEDSESGNLQILRELKRRGLNSSFFGNIIHTGSAVQSIEQVLSRSIDAAAIDSSVLKQYLIERPHLRGQLHVLTSYGPLPAHPILVNARMSAADKTLIADKLLQMNSCEEWQTELAKFNVWGFKAVKPAMYRDDEPTPKDHNMSLHTAYY